MIFYYVEHLNYGDKSDKTGWYLMRATLVDDRGTGLRLGSITDLTPVAMFGAGASSKALPTDPVFEARQIQDAARTGKLVVMPQDWTIATLAKAIG